MIELIIIDPIGRLVFSECAATRQYIRERIVSVVGAVMYTVRMNN